MLIGAGFQCDIDTARRLAKLGRGGRGLHVELLDDVDRRLQRLGVRAVGADNPVLVVDSIQQITILY